MQHYKSYRLKGAIGSAAFPAKGLFFPEVHVADEGLMYGISPAPYRNHAASQTKVVGAVPGERLAEQRDGAKPFFIKS